MQRENLCNNDNPAKKARSISRMQQALIAAQELGDEKMNLLQTILDKIEFKTRLLDQDFKNLDFGKEDQGLTENKEQQAPLNSNNSNNPVGGNERPPKRARRTRHDTFSGLENNHNDVAPIEHVLRSQAPTNTNNSNSNQKKTTTGLFVHKYHVEFQFF